MALGIRGINPIWMEFDLTGHIFDDSFYMYVLQNTIPYIPTPIFSDVDLSIPLPNPLQFFANGTLPVDMFWDPTQVYRLEFRQNNGINPPSQADALIYEVNNYVPGTGGSTPITTVAFPSTNQVTNPQFALVNFGDQSVSPPSVNITSAGTYEVAPGWFLDLAGSGTATITQVPFSSLNPNPSNAPYALHLVLAGWNADSVILRQRFHQNGLLWSNKVIAAAVTAATGTGFQSLTANLVDDLGTPLATVLSIPVISTTLTQYTGHGALPSSTDTTVPPAAYIEFQVHLSSNNDIYLTSFQLIVEDATTPFEPAFTQDSVDRQIDHTYNTAYPIVPVGTVIDFSGFVVPEHFKLCDGTAYNRIQLNQLFQALTKVETVTLTMGGNTFTVVSSADYRIGMAVEGNGIPASTTISNISGTTITISHNATISGSSAVRFFGWGNGNGSTTFNVPDVRDFVIAGLGGSLFSSSHGNGVGGSGGAATHTVGLNEIPNHTHDPLGGTGYWMNSTGQPQGVAAPAASALSEPTTGTMTGYTGQTALSLVQQTALMKKCIRFE